MTTALQVTAQQAGARAAIYGALAAALSLPHPGLFDDVAAAVVAGVDELTSPACEQALLALTAQGSCSLGQLAREYRRVMTPTGCRPLALYESLHRHGRLMGEATLAVKQWYRRLGVEPGDGELADHASVELAFLAELAVVESEVAAAGNRTLVRRLQQEQRAFLEAHAGVWLPELGVALATSPSTFYGTIGGWLRGFLQEERSGRTRVRRQGRPQPALAVAENCTLCGLCTGRCPTGALRVEEDDCTTVLALHTRACSGCGRCMTICPEAVLVMEAPAGKDARIALRHSPRESCPGCGCPTVSRAELAGVLARLGDGALVHVLQLCPTCKATHMGVIA